MTDEFHKPTQYSGDKFDTYEGGEDPASILRAAHDTAHALVNRARETDDDAVVERLVAYTDQHGVDALAELWARSSPGGPTLFCSAIRAEPTGDAGQQHPTDQAPPPPHAAQTRARSARRHGCCA